VSFDLEEAPMTTIIAGGFEELAQAQAAVERLMQAGISPEYVCKYRVNPAGEHHAIPAGGLKEIDTEPQLGQEDVRPAETLVAVNADAAGLRLSEDEIVSLLEECGAKQVERAEGRWADGEWADFDPVSRPRLIGGEDHHARRA
jgi:hypothetical protein